MQSRMLELSLPGRFYLRKRSVEQFSRQATQAPRRELGNLWLTICNTCCTTSGDIPT